MHAHRDCLPRWGLRIESLDLAGDRHGIHEQAVDGAIAETGDIAQFRWVMQDLDGEWIVRVGRLRSERQPCAWGESTEAGGAGVVAEAGDWERVLGDAARAHERLLTWRRRNFPARSWKGQ